jgi:hypothetical protein
MHRLNRIVGDILFWDILISCASAPRGINNMSARRANVAVQLVVT